MMKRTNFDDEDDVLDQKDWVRVHWRMKEKDDKGHHDLWIVKKKKVNQEVRNWSDFEKSFLKMIWSWRWWRRSWRRRGSMVGIDWDFESYLMRKKDDGVWKKVMGMDLMLDWNWDQMSWWKIYLENNSEVWF